MRAKIDSRHCTYCGRSHHAVGRLEIVPDIIVVGGKIHTVIEKVCEECKNRMLGTGFNAKYAAAAR